MPDDHDSVITISLLDPLRGLSVQAWEFDGTMPVRIGRAETNDVIIKDMLVSREHGVLTPQEGRWSITPLGRNGILLDSRQISGPTFLRNEAGLRLGIAGPSLEFLVGRKRNDSARAFMDQHGPAAAAVEHEEETKRAARTDVTEMDLVKRLQQDAQPRQRK